MYLELRLVSISFCLCLSPLVQQLVRLAASHLKPHTLTSTAPSAGQADPHTTEIPHAPPPLAPPPHQPHHALP